MQHCILGLYIKTSCVPHLGSCIKMGSLFLPIIAVAMFLGSCLNTPFHGSAEDLYDFQTDVQKSVRAQCDTSDLGCIENFLQSHQASVEETKSTAGDPFSFISLIRGQDYTGPEMAKRKDYTETEFKSHYMHSCACQSKYEPLDLGYNNFPRYLMNAVCLNHEDGSRKCWRGSRCKEVPFKVHVLTHRTNQDILKDERFDDDARTSSLLPDSLRSMWRVKVVTVAATCQCTQ
ncbi:prothoracicotropic hormone [Sergentomyia squamirostris]